jgi:hypothetical protein
MFFAMIWLVLTKKGLVMTLINFCLFAVPSGYVDQTTKAAIVNAAYFKVNFAYYLRLAQCFLFVILQ